MSDLRFFSTNDLKNELKRREECKKEKYTNIIVFGPPGSGKGTQASLFKCLCKFSSGDIFRKKVLGDSEEGKKAKFIMDKGELLPDDLAFKLLDIENFIQQEECTNGVVFDGFPRAMTHIVHLEKVFKNLIEKHKDEYKYKIHKVFNLYMDENKLLERVGGRLVHVPSGRVYHKIHNPPKVVGKDDLTGDDLIERTDEKMILKRIRVYDIETKPILNYYSNILNNINADDNIENVHKNILSLINKLI